METGLRLRATCHISQFVLVVLYPNQFSDIVPPFRSLGEDLGADIFRQLRGAGEDPEILGGFAADESVGIVIGEKQDTIIAVEGAEEGDTEDSRSFGPFGLAKGKFIFAVFESVITDLDLTVVLQRILRLAVRQATLEGMVITGNLIPGTEILFEFKWRRDRGIINFLCRAAQSGTNTHNNTEY